MTGQHIVRFLCIAATSAAIRTSVILNIRDKAREPLDWTSLLFSLAFGIIALPIVRRFVVSSDDIVGKSIVATKLLVLSILVGMIPVDVIAIVSTTRSGSWVNVIGYSISCLLISNVPVKQPDLGDIAEKH